MSNTVELRDGKYIQIKSRPMDEGWDERYSRSEESGIPTEEINIQSSTCPEEYKNPEDPKPICLTLSWGQTREIYNGRSETHPGYVCLHFRGMYVSKGQMNVRCACEE